MIINTVSIGPNYRKLTVSCPGMWEADYIPGQCIKVDGRFFAVAETRHGEFDIVVPTSKAPHWDAPVRDIEFPVGSGFPDADAPEAHFVAGGSGIGAAVSFVRRRSRSGLRTSLVAVGRRLRRDELLAAFPVLGSVELECWDSEAWGRPLCVEMLPSHVMTRRPSVFFAGPKGMSEALRESVDLKLNF